jgi:RNA polymerase sigma-70 factor (ECF subfamily)
LSADGDRTRGSDVESLFVEHAAALLAFACRLCRRRADAEDLVQETAVLAFTHQATLRDPAKARPWLFRILANRWKSSGRRFLRRELHDVPIEEALAEIERREPAWAAERNAIAGVDHRRLLAALATLPVAMKEVLWLADIEGFTLREIAEIADCAPGTAASRLARGRAALRARVGAGVGRAR